MYLMRDTQANGKPARSPLILYALTGLYALGRCYGFLLTDVSRIAWFSIVVPMVSARRGSRKVSAAVLKAMLGVLGFAQRKG
jgi:hypothetical protein